MFFRYQIVPRGGNAGQALAIGTLYIADAESAKRHVQTVTVRGVAAKPGLEAVLQDEKGAEI